MLESPDERIGVQITLPTPGSAETPRWSATFRGKAILHDCRLSLEAQGEGDLLAGVRVRSERRRSADSRVKVLFGRAAAARDRYREARFTLENPQHRRIEVVFRCYDDAIAFRYETPRQNGMERIVITEENTSFALDGNPAAIVQYPENFQTSHEHNAVTTDYHGLKTDTLIDMPALFVREDGTHLAITEAALRRYAGMYLMRPAGRSEEALLCRLAPRPDGTMVARDLPMATPWRVVLVGERAGTLLESNTLYCLNDPPAIGDTSWIRPGKMTWAWWNGNVVADGKASPPIFSMEAQRAYIDFCAANGIPYHAVIADNEDTPWYRQSNKGIAPGPDTDVTQVRADLDLASIRRYAESKGVRLWTWVHQAALRGRVEAAFAAFEKLGWSGMMVDFFDHDDQETVEHAEAILQAAARHHILIHFHGIWKPTGWQRTYPNLMNHEGVLNLEYLKWSDRCTPEHTLKMLFTRMVAGPMDYHAGGFRAVRPERFTASFVAPNVLGTRCHQLASYICFDNPNPMVADYPGAYEGQPGFDFLRAVPTWWDETRVLVGEAGEALVTARRKGQVWYMGGMAAGKPREVTLALSFLGGGQYQAHLWQDAPETEADPNRLAEETFAVSSSETRTVRIGTDGGFALILTPER
jgi:alpha-glucosidase